MLLLNEKLYKSIREVAEELHVNESLLRYWETQFEKLKPVRRSGKRLYTSGDIEIAKKIKQLLHEEGFTIKGAQKFLENYRREDSQEGLSNIIEYLRSLKNFLARYSE